MLNSCCCVHPAMPTILGRMLCLPAASLVFIDAWKAESSWAVPATVHDVPTFNVHTTAFRNWLSLLRYYPLGEHRRAVTFLQGIITRARCAYENGLNNHFAILFAPSVTDSYLLALLLFSAMLRLHVTFPYLKPTTLKDWIIVRIIIVVR